MIIAVTPNTIEEQPSNLKHIYFAGGCFWGVEEYFSRITGVYDVLSGYANGHTQAPTYEQVLTQTTGYAEAVQVSYNPSQVSLQTLTELFFSIIDPISVNRQGNDRGTQYRTGIYFIDKEDKEVIAQVMLLESGKYTQPLAVELLPLIRFHLAEEYHQDYLKKNPHGYCHIDFSALPNSTKDKILQQPQHSYSKPSETEIKKQLSTKQFKVTQLGETESPFTGEYCNHKELGIYVDIVTGEPLFISTDKYDSGSGWPSFTKPIHASAVVEKQDHSFDMNRTEIKSRFGDTHLGHVFTDGPQNRGGRRYCVNSAALRFIPYKDMDKEGYGQYKPLLES